jgi:light-independent protochlorophyllide reductase subunit B
MRELAASLGLEALITDDYLEVEDRIAALHPELVLGTQMERHVAKRLGVPCAVISAPVHVQDFPARYSPQMGFEGANVIFDTWVHPLMMGLEEHLLQMFRSDFEFNDEAAPSHLGHGPSRGGEQPAEVVPEPVPVVAPSQDGPLAGADVAVLEAPVQAKVEEKVNTKVAVAAAPVGAPVWDARAEQELRKIPFFVRGKARRNTERFATERGLETITLDTLYDAKAHFGR